MVCIFLAPLQNLFGQVQSLMQTQSPRADNHGFVEDNHSLRDCHAKETEFAQDFELAQEDLERREKNANHKRTMHMWENALEHVWKTRPIEPNQRPIIETEGGKQNSDLRM